MAKKAPNELHWDMMKKNQIRDEYNQYLTEEGRENNSHSAHLFALTKIGGGHEYMGLKERDLILFLAGELPNMYD